MSRATIANLKAVCEYLYEVTHKVYTFAPVGNGMWKVGEKVADGFVSLGDPKSLKDWITFLDAYRRGYGACLEDLSTDKSRELSVDGHSKEEGVFTGDGTHPPFVVFDADKQENIAGPFNTRQEAASHRLAILMGAKPKLDGKALGAWLDKIDSENGE